MQILFVNQQTKTENEAVINTVIAVMMVMIKKTVKFLFSFCRFWVKQA